MAFISHKYSHSLCDKCLRSVKHIIVIHRKSDGAVNHKLMVHFNIAYTKIVRCFVRFSPNDVLFSGQANRCHWVSLIFALAPPIPFSIELRMYIYIEKIWPLPAEALLKSNYVWQKIHRERHTSKTAANEWGGREIEIESERENESKWSHKSEFTRMHTHLTDINEITQSNQMK